MVNIKLLITGIIFVVIGLLLLANPGFMGTGLGYAFCLGGILVFIVGLIRGKVLFH